MDCCWRRNLRRSIAPSSALIVGRGAVCSAMITADIEDKPIEEILDVSPLLRRKFITLQLIGKGGVRRKSHARALGANKSLRLATVGQGVTVTLLSVISVLPRIKQGRRPHASHCAGERRLFHWPHLEARQGSFALRNWAPLPFMACDKLNTCRPTADAGNFQEMTDSANIVRSQQVCRPEFSPVQNQRYRSRLAFGASGLIVILAAVAFFAGDHRAAAIIAGQACLVVCLTYGAAKRDRARLA